MESCDVKRVLQPDGAEESLRALAEQGLALNQAFRTARDAVQGTEDRRAKWAAYNLLHVDFDKACRAILNTPMATPQSQEAPVPAAAPQSLFDMGLDNPRLGAFR